MFAELKGCEHNACSPFSFLRKKKISVEPSAKYSGFLLAQE
jgi:hypothetical protein